MTSRQREWQKAKQSQGMKPIKPLLTIEAQEAMKRLTEKSRTMQAVVNEAIIYLDIMERENARHH
jgi:hypothetical protein